MHMKRIAAVSLGALLTVSAWGQHAGSGGHAGGGFSSGRSFSAPSSAHAFGGAPAYRPSVSAQRSFPYSTPAPIGGTYPYSYGGNSYGSRRSPYYGGNYRSNYSRGVYVVPGWLGSGYYDPGYGLDNSDQEQATAPPPDAYAQQGPPPSDDQAYAQVTARPAYQGGAYQLGANQGGASAPPDLQEQPQITLIFKDGRPDQVVQNYAVTRTTLYVLDGARRREIPLDQLNLPQTEKTNRDAGVDFEIPATD